MILLSNGSLAGKPQTWYAERVFFKSAYKVLCLQRRSYPNLDRNELYFIQLEKALTGQIKQAILFIT